MARITYSATKILGRSNEILKFLQTSVGVDIEERYLHGNNLDEEDLPVVVDLDAAMF